MAEKSIRFVLLAFVVGVMARHLGASSMGTLTYAASLAAWAAFLVNQGLDQLAVRRILGSPSTQEKQDIVCAVFLLRLLGFFCTATILLIWSYWFQNKDDTLFYCTFIFGFSYLGMVGDGADVLFQSQLKNRISALSRLGGTVIGSAMRLILVWQSASLVYFALAQLIETFCYAFFQWLAYREFTKNQSTHFSLGRASRQLKALLVEGWPLLVVSICVLIYSRFDQVFLGLLGAKAELGHYSLSLKVLDYVNVFTLILLTSSFPLIVAYTKGEWSQSIERALKSLCLALLAAVVVSSALWWLAPTVMNLLYGSEFTVQGGELLSIVIWMFPLTMFGVFRQAIYTAQGSLKTAMFAELSSLFMIVGLNCMMVPHYGAKGAAWALILAAVLHHVLVLLLGGAAGRAPYRIYCSVLVSGVNRIIKSLISRNPKSIG